MLVSGHTSQTNDSLVMIMMVWLKRPKSQGSHTQINGQAPDLLLLFTPIPTAVSAHATSIEGKFDRQAVAASVHWARRVSSTGPSGLNRSIIVSTDARACRALGGKPVTTGRNCSQVNECSWRSVAARTMAVRDIRCSSAISPNPSPAPSLVIRRPSLTIPWSARQCPLPW
jgi:hypothetical protein